VPQYHITHTMSILLHRTDNAVLSSSFPASPLLKNFSWNDQNIMGDLSVLVQSVNWMHYSLAKDRGCLYCSWIWFLVVNFRLNNASWSTYSADNWNSSWCRNISDTNKILLFVLTGTNDIRKCWCNNKQKNDYYSKPEKIKMLTSILINCLMYNFFGQ